MLGNYRGKYSSKLQARLQRVFETTGHAHSKQLFTEHLHYACAKTSDNVVKKTLRVPGVEIRIPFLICYLQLLYKIELDRCFCPELAGHVTNQNISADEGKPM